MLLAKPALLPWFSGDWHTPAIAWLMFCLFCIQIVAHEICFVLLFFFPSTWDIVTWTDYLLF